MSYAFESGTYRTNSCLSTSSRVLVRNDAPRYNNTGGTLRRSSSFPMLEDASIDGSSTIFWTKISQESTVRVKEGNDRLASEEEEEEEKLASLFGA